MRVIVCGGRDFDDVSAVRHALTAAHARRPITLLIEGGQTGADRLAREWAKAEGVPFVTVEAEWQRFGPAAGPIRNSKMLTEQKPDAVIAFPGNKGTRDMVTIARKAGVPVWEPFKPKAGE